MEFGYYHPSRGYWQTTDEPPQDILDSYPAGTRVVPVKPASNREWNGTAWVPGLTPEQELEDKRNVAVLSRAEFFMASRRAGILTKSEALAAAAGEVPAFFIAALAALVASGDMTQGEADDAEILLAGLTQVERNHPLLPIAQTALNLTDAQVDALFGI